MTNLERIANVIPWVLCVILVTTTVYFYNAAQEPVIVTEQVPCEPVIIEKIVETEVPFAIETPCDCACEGGVFFSQEEPEVPVCNPIKNWECQRGSGGWGVRYIEKECTNGQTLIFDCQTNTSRYS